MPDRERPTDEVADEGGSAGNLERRDEDGTAHGSEGTSTVARVDRAEHTLVRDETGTTGRRSPIGSAGADGATDD